MEHLAKIDSEPSGGGAIYLASPVQQASNTNTAMTDTERILRIAVSNFIRVPFMKEDEFVNGTLDYLQAPIEEASDEDILLALQDWLADEMERKFG